MQIIYKVIWSSSILKSLKKKKNDANNGNETW